jgi:hypothetical protein
MTSQSIYISTDFDDDGNHVGQRQTNQSVSYAATITPDPWEGSVIVVGSLTGNITINNVTSTKLLAGTRMTFHFTQDGVGGHTVTWNAAYIENHIGASGTANQKAHVEFVYSGSEWLCVGGYDWHA